MTALGVSPSMPGATAAADRSCCIGVVGSGTMGRGIAQIAAQAGLSVRVFDHAPAAAADARASIGKTLQTLVDKGRVSADDAAATLGRLTPVDSLDGLAGCDVVVEAIVENLAAKQALFAALESLLPETAILATNTSSLSVTAVASACTRPQRVVGWHFFNPVPVMRIAEVVPGLRTDAAVTDAVMALTRRLGHQPVRAQDSPGFIVNHAGRAFIPEGLRLLAEGVAGVEDIDAVLRDLAGFRLGPFELADLIGLDNAEDVMQSLYRAHQDEPRFRITPLVATRVAAGLLGRKSGQGFYRHGGAPPVPSPPGNAPAAPSLHGDAPAAPTLPGGPPPAAPSLGNPHEAAGRASDTAPVGGELETPPPLWIGRHETDLADRVRSLLAGVELEAGSSPSAEALILITPVGLDVSTACAQWQLDPRRTVAIDALFSLDKRCALMVAPGILPRYRQAALRLFGATGRRVSLLRDSPGFIAQRVVAQIVNIACDMAQQRIAAPADIDAAVRLALGYPLGPFGFAEAIGPGRILQITLAAHDAWLEPRYRPSVWLRRRVLGGLPLDHGD